MLSVVLCAAALALAALLVGHLVLHLCRLTTSPWLAPVVGISALLVVCEPVARLPGRSVTSAVLVAALAVAGAVVVVRDPRTRPSWQGLVSAVPAFLLALVPFAAAGRGGTLGMSFNNDMASHLLWADGIRDAAVAAINPLPGDYPLGPHGVVAALADLTGVRTDLAFAGLTAAIPVLLAWTVQATLSRDAGVVARTFVATLAGVPFIVAGYYGQGSFKEVLQAVLVVGLVVATEAAVRERGRARWVPAGVVIAGTVSNYSFQGLAWAGAGAVVAAAVLLAGWLVRGGVVRRTREAVSGHARAGAIALAILVLVLLPQAGRLHQFFSNNAGTNLTGIPKESLGNLAGRITGWAALGPWDSADYRLAGTDAFGRGLWAGVVLVLVLAGAVWWVRRGQWLVPVMGLVALLIWVYSDHSQSPYVAAKALVVLAPFAVLMWARPLAEQGRAWSTPARLAAVVVALVVGVKLVDTSLQALRFSKVAPTGHLAELRSLQGDLHGQPTLLLSNDDFTRWNLNRTPVQSPVISYQRMDVRPEKPLVYGEAYDFDSVPSAAYREYRWVIAPHDPAGSAPPSGLQRVRSTRSYDLYRVGGVRDRTVLAGEGSAAAARLRCSSRAGRELLRTGGLARLRPPTRSVAVGGVAPGTNLTVGLSLGPGVWELETPYTGEHPLDVSAPGLTASLPANLERPGTRWPIGRIVVPRATVVPIRFAATKKRLTPASAADYPNAVIATRVDRPREVPVAQACGRMVDHVIPRKTS